MVLATLGGFANDLPFISGSLGTVRTAANRSIVDSRRYYFSFVLSPGPSCYGSWWFQGVSINFALELTVVFSSIECGGILNVTGHGFHTQGVVRWSGR